MSVVLLSVMGASGDIYDIARDAAEPGGAGSTLYRCRDRQGRERLYKLFAAPITDVGMIEWVTRAADFGREIVLAAEQRVGSSGAAASSMTWPIDVVVQGGALVGVVLPAGPGDFVLADGSPLTFDRLYLEVESPPDAYLRVAVLIRACEIVEMLDERVLVYSERFGLALLIYQGLFLAPDAPPSGDDAWQPASGIPEDLDPHLRTLLDRALGGPQIRPSAGEWRAGLREVFLTPDGAFYRQDSMVVLDWHTQQFRKAGPAPTTAGIPAPATAPFVPPPPSWPAAPTYIPPTNPVPPNRPVPSNNSGAWLAGILVAVAALVAVVSLVALNIRDTDEVSTASSSSPYAYDPTTSSYAHYTPTTTPPFDWNSLGNAATDKTPFTSNALLPQSFRDSKNVEYTLRAGGVKDCITRDMSQNVKNILTQYHCSEMIAGSYIDQSNQILVSVNVMAFPTTAEADSLYETMKGQTQDWAVWCPQEGAGASVCDSYVGYATRSGWGAKNYRYVFKSTALYINLTQDTDIRDWLDAASSAVVSEVGPENYWQK